MIFLLRLLIQRQLLRSNLLRQVRSKKIKIQDQLYIIHQIMSLLVIYYQTQVILTRSIRAFLYLRKVNQPLKLLVNMQLNQMNFNKTMRHLLKDLKKWRTVSKNPIWMKSIRELMTLRIQNILSYILDSLRQKLRIKKISRLIIEWI